MGKLTNGELVFGNQDNSPNCPFICNNQTPSSATTKSSWSVQMKFSASSFLYLTILVGAFCLIGLMAPSNSLARMEYECGWNHTEGDPGDGDDSMGSGGGSMEIDNSDQSLTGDASNCIVIFDAFRAPQFGDLVILIVPPRDMDAMPGAPFANFLLLSGGKK
jgi:hypothetical protein